MWRQSLHWRQLAHAVRRLHRCCLGVEANNASIDPAADCGEVDARLRAGGTGEFDRGPVQRGGGRCGTRRGERPCRLQGKPADRGILLTATQETAPSPPHPTLAAAAGPARCFAPRWGQVETSLLAKRHHGRNMRCTLFFVRENDDIGGREGLASSLVQHAETVNRMCDNNQPPVVEPIQIAYFHQRADDRRDRSLGLELRGLCAQRG
mmetsp:Transcript_18149/g.59373  ORF Transcript_18149/g.59373 Transcript_18149/m.59373 type:complete len:208 (+) Transcript_18149:776-1399(+)